VIDEDDERALNMFMPTASSNQQRTLADLIMSKIREKEDGGMEEADVPETETQGLLSAPYEKLFYFFFSPTTSMFEQRWWLVSSIPKLSLYILSTFIEYV
jgi:hypothetical protein